jgi:GT2 family glycosyltransferase
MLKRAQRTSARGIGSSSPERPRVAGKFLYHGERKLWVRGVTYGTFRARADGCPYGSPGRVERDFARMARSGLNAVRTYTVPPRWLLDAARRHGLWVMVGLPWEQHVAFLDDRARARDIEARVRAGVEACAGHPALLAHAVGNEIPSPIARWYGRARIQRYVERLCRAAKAEDPGALITYVNYPTTEYLDLAMVDFVTFNVYLESRERFDAYLARLQNIAGDRPLVLGELGLDSRRHGQATQARTLDWQIRTTFAAGCAGAFVFAWTDEWHRGGHDVEDWDFGLVRRDGRAKKALEAVRKAFADVPLAKGDDWPLISVVVCSYNGSRTIRECLDGLLRLEYPNYEVIVVDDGSTDATPAIVREYGFRLVSMPGNQGLSSARNAGWQAASGSIVAYIDDDAWPDPHWLGYLAVTFQNTPHLGVGGPNIPPPDDDLVARCVADSPGGPTHVLVSDREAEHLPGCNMAFRKAALEAVGGFDPQFRAAGDDVDLCWRLQERGGTLGFHPGAMVWHRRRNSVRGYWRQQRGYGRAEALLERKWPERYNGAGHVTWTGRLYGTAALSAFPWGGRVYHGVWGTAPFQSLYEPAPGPLAAVTAMPEAYLLAAALALLAALGLSWRPLAVAGCLAAVTLAMIILQAVLGATRRSRFDPATSALTRLRRRALTALLHLLQPLARLTGRLEYGLTPWRRRETQWLVASWLPPPVLWRETWQSAAATLEGLEQRLKSQAVAVVRGGDYDAWDLDLTVGAFSSARVLMAIEEHGNGRQLVRCRAWPRGTPAWLASGGLCATLALAAGLEDAWLACGVLAAAAAGIACRMVVDYGGAMAALWQALGHGAGALAAPARSAETIPDAADAAERAA